MRRLKTFVVGAAFAALSALPVYATIPAVPMFLPAVPPSPSPPPPTILTPPYEAKDAGFTTLAANYDWTGKTQSSVGGSNITLGPTSNWLACPGQTPTNPQWWSLGYGSGNAAPCSAYFYVTDSLNGLQTLDVHWDNTLLSNDNSWANVLQTQGIFGSYSVGTFFPVATYIEFYARFNTGNTGDTPCVSGNLACIFADVWEYSPDGTEWDFIEVYGGNPQGDGGCDEAGQSGCNGAANYSGYNPEAWNKYGERVTYTGSQEQVCYFINDQQIACNPVSNLNVGTAREYQILLSGPQTNSSNAIANGQNVELWMQWMRVWSCSSWKTTECTGQLVPGS